MSIVFDASLTLSWYFEDERTPAVDAVLDEVVAGGEFQANASASVVDTLTPERRSTLMRLVGGMDTAPPTRSTTNKRYWQSCATTALSTRFSGSRRTVCKPPSHDRKRDRTDRNRRALHRPRQAWMPLRRSGASEGRKRSNRRRADHAGHPVRGSEIPRRTVQVDRRAIHGRCYYSHVRAGITERRGEGRRGTTLQARSGHRVG